MIRFARDLSTLDAESAKEVASAVAAIVVRMEEDGDETGEFWDDDEDVLEAALLAPLRPGIDDWLDEDEDAVRRWMRDYDGPGRAAARVILLARDANDDPEAAMAEFDTLRGRGALDVDLEGASGVIAAALFASDAESARAWVDVLPTGALRDDAVSRLAGEWVHKAAPAASEWIATLAPGRVRDSAVNDLAQKIQWSDPEAALQWALSIGQEGFRGNAVGSVLSDWRDRDPAVAKAAVAARPGAKRYHELYFLSEE